ENLRANRSLVIVANHSSHLDTLCLLAALPLRKLHRAFPAAAADYFFQSVPRTFIAAVVTNALPFERRVRVRRSLSICSELLSDPETILIIFPEGTRAETGETREFKSGIGALVAGRDVTVLPCYLQGAIFAWDARGHGRSAGERGAANNFADVIRDLDTFARHISERYEIPIENMIVLAHSLAAISVAGWVHDYAPPIRAMILATAAFHVKLY